MPAGTCAWTSSLTIPKGLSLVGASTVLSRSGVLFAIAPDATAIANEETISVTGFVFEGNDAATQMMTVTGSASGKAYKGLLIYGNTFRNSATASSAVLTIVGQVRGLIHSNTFDRCGFVWKIMGNDSTSEWESLTFEYGSVDNLYFENNTIQYSSSFVGGDPGWVEVGQGGRVVVRYNTWNMTNATLRELWDVHGFQNWDGTPGSGQTGTMLVEYYNNTISNAAGYRWVNHRGSWGMFHNNVATGAGSMPIEVNQYAAGCAGLISPAPVAYNPAVNNTYSFSNTKNGTEVPMAAGSVGLNCGVAENTSFWNLNASFDGTAGVGVGVAASRPATCTSGVAYWATDEGYWDATHVGADGRLYKCTATNTWTLYYTPYTYPHPLRGWGFRLTGGSITGGRQ